MITYHKIQTVFKRNPNNMKNVIEGDYSKEEFDYLKDNGWTFTEKVDGTNIRVIWKDGQLEFRGKTDNAQIPGRLLKALQEMFSLERFQEYFQGDVCLYGEGYGSKIQKVGSLYRPDNSFVLFDILVGSWWLKRHDIEDIATKFGIDIVPIIGQGTLQDMTNLCKTGFKSIWGEFLAEGIVARPAIELFCRDGSRVITKLKLSDFR